MQFSFSKERDLLKLKQLYDKDENIIHQLFGKQRKTLLHLSVENKRIDMVTYILDNGTRGESDTILLNIILKEAHSTVICIPTHLFIWLQRLEKLILSTFWWNVEPSWMVEMLKERHLFTWQQGPGKQVTEIFWCKWILLFCLEVLSMLFHHGANTSLKENNGNGIIHAAALNGDYETLSIIDKEDICDINSKNKTRDTPLHLLCTNDKLPDTKSIQFLLEKGASLDQK